MNRIYVLTLNGDCASLKHVAEFCREFEVGREFEVACVSVSERPTYVEVAGVSLSERASYVGHKCNASANQNRIRTGPFET